MLIPGRLLLAASLLLPVSGCALFGGQGEASAQPDPQVIAWREVATEADRDRISAWRDSWNAALAKVAAAGQAGKLASSGALMEPDAALPDPAPPPGDYNCKVFKLGAQSPGGLDYVAYPPFTCRIAMEKDILSFAKIGGSQKPVGLLFPNDDHRMIFLGTMMLGDETRAIDYGRDAERDMAGAFERIGPKRWRLVLPRPHWESMLDVIELAPKS